MPAVIVPARAGVLSAVGLVYLAASTRARAVVVRSHRVRRDSRPRSQRAREPRPRRSSDRTRQIETALDCRYVGQSHELTVPCVDEFHAEHARRNGYARPDTAGRGGRAAGARHAAPAPLAISDLPAPTTRDAVTGPAVVAEPDCTVWVPAGWRADAGPARRLDPPERSA